LLNFQFPLSERTNCNKDAIPARRPSEHAFSFLYRNERTATPPTGITFTFAVCLSVSSIGTNELQHLCVQGSRFVFDRFQFPLSERTNCNREHAGTAVLLPGLSVSSIGTNELQLFAFGHTRCHNSRFQFPLSERTNCNVSAIPGDGHRSVLSVSSIGTNELQPRNSLCAPSASSLSVSSIGTNELQHIHLFAHR